MPPMRFNDADEHAHTFTRSLPARLQHGVSLPDTRTHAEKDEQPALFYPGFVALHFGEQRIGIGSVFVIHGIGGELGYELELSHLVECEIQLQSVDVANDRHLH